MVDPQRDWGVVEGSRLRARARQVACFFCVTLLLPGEGRAVAEQIHPTRVDPAEVRSKALCPALFGTEEVRAANRAHRESKLGWHLDSTMVVNLVHSSKWKSPERTNIEGVELVGTDLAGTDHPLAWVKITSPNTGCPEGSYPVMVDDMIRSNRVLVILDGVVLVEGGNKLHYLKAEGAFTPAWRLTWKSSWSIPIQLGAAGPTGGGGGARYSSGASTPRPGGGAAPAAGPAGRGKPGARRPGARGGPARGPARAPARGPRGKGP